MFRKQSNPENGELGTTAPMEWKRHIPHMSTDPTTGEATLIWTMLPLESGICWVDFEKLQNNARYTFVVWGIWPDGSQRPVRRADVHFEKPTPGWPMAVMVNKEPQRLDGLLDFGFEIHPFERKLTVVQTAGSESVIKVAGLTGFTQPASVGA